MGEKPIKLWAKTALKAILWAKIALRGYSKKFPLTVKRFPLNKRVLLAKKLVPN